MRQATFRSLFSCREYRTLFAADVVSMLGDQIAVVALAVLLYQRSGSALVAALGYASGFLPWLLLGPVLAALAERMPARTVLVGTDLARGCLIAAAAVPGMPLPLLALLVFASAVLAPPFDASASATTVQILDERHYPIGVSARVGMHQVAQLVGFASGGVIVAFVTARGALALDAASFLVSALLVRRGLRWRPPAKADTGDTAASTGVVARCWADTVEGVRIVVATPALRRPLLLAVTGAAYVIVPEAIAAALASRYGGGPGTVGLIMAAVAFGAASGGVLLGRLATPAVRQRSVLPMALAGTLPLLAFLTSPALPVALGLLVLAGAASSFQVAASVSFGSALPEGARARCFAVAMAALFGGQSLAIILAGAAAMLWSPQVVVAGAAALGGAVLLLFVPSPAQRRRHRERPGAASLPEPVVGAVLSASRTAA